MNKDIPSITSSDNCVEVQIIQACLQNQAAWENLLIAWLSSDNAWLQRRCATLLGSHADAEDAVQEITLKVIGGITRFEGRSSLRTWVRCIADNHCFTLIKKRSSHALTDHLQHCIALVEADRFTEAAPDALEQVVDRVHSTLKRLTDINREILELRYLDEQSIRQMADKLNLTQSATKMRLYRAMDIFKLKFQKISA